MKRKKGDKMMKNIIRNIVNSWKKEAAKKKEKEMEISWMTAEIADGFYMS